LRDGAPLISAVRKRARNVVDAASNQSKDRQHYAYATACREGCEVAIHTLTAWFIQHDEICAQVIQKTPCGNEGAPRCSSEPAPPVGRAAHISPHASRKR
jgi:hypothetical protein